jgi:hypothetical protein
LKRHAGLAVLAPLSLVSLATVGFEIALTRYFAVAKWSEYGYWVISIVLAGFALSGVVMALGRPFFTRHGQLMLDWLPVVLIGAGAVGFHFVTTNPFNPLQLQNQATFETQLVLIAGYYVALLPFFFLAGLFVSLCFILNDQEIGRVYGFDLTGAGVGSIAALALMGAVHPFMLLPCLLVPLALATGFSPSWKRVFPAALLVLAASEALLIGGNRAEFNDYKAIYAPLHTPDAKVLSEIRSARGLYMILEDFTERVDTDLSNNAGMLGVGGPPATYGLYRDGNRIAALPKSGTLDAGYSVATLAALPYELVPRARTLLIGSSGGFRAVEARVLGAASVDVLEPDTAIRALLRRAVGGQDTVSGRSPIAAVSGTQYDIIDIAGDFLDSSEANTQAFTTEAVAAYLGALSHDGILSIPVSIREFPAYAVRMLATVRAGLVKAGLSDPGKHVLVYRSAWNVRILVSPQEFGAARIAVARRFSSERSFDLSYFPGVEQAPRPDIFNDLPAVSFAEGEVVSGDGAHDAIADEAPGVLRGEQTSSGQAFDLRPITLDRPSCYSVLRLSQLGTILKRLEILPQAEIGPLVNLAVLAQASVIALVVLAVPLFGGRRVAAKGISPWRAAVYFASLGLGFLFIELYLIERASFYLNDRTSGFAMVLTAMLIFSGLGSMLSGRFEQRPRRGIDVAIVIVVAWCAAVYFGLEPALMATLDEGFMTKAVFVVVVVAPVSVALGMPFPLGLSRAGTGGFMPWAWGLNGAFSVVSTPLANLIALQMGYSSVLIAALALYGVANAVFPRDRKNVT